MGGTSRVAGYEVVCRAVAPFLEAFRERGLPIDELLEGVEFDLSHLEDSTKRIHWTSFTRILDNATRFLSNDELEELGYQNVFKPWSRPFVVGARVLQQDLRGLIRFLGTEGRLPTVECAHSTVESDEPGLSYVRVRLSEGCSVSVPFLIYLRGFFAALGPVVYSRRARVEMDLLPDGAIYTIRYVYPPGLSSRIRLAMARIALSPVVVRFLRNSYVELAERFHELVEQRARREEAEGKIERAAARFRALVEHSDDVVLIVDEALRWSYASPAAERLLSSELSMQTLLPAVAPADRAQLTAAIRRLQRDPSRPQWIAVRLEDPATGERLLEGHVSSHLADPAVEGFILRAKDVTAQRALERRLAQGERLEAIGRVAGGVAHDFNNYLTVILGSASQLGARMPDDDSNREIVDEIILAAEDCNALTHQLLNFGQRSLVDGQSLDMRSRVEELTPLLRTMAGHDVAVEVSLHDGPLEVRADPSELQQILTNLVTNARDAMPTGGVIHIALSATEVSADQPLAVETGLGAGSYAHLNVTDSGQGMDETTVDRIFEPFFTTKPGGTGLGLASVYRIAEQNGGAVRVVSKPGSGSSFTVLWPLQTLASNAQKELAAPPRPENVRSARILLVDDDDACRRVARAMLESAGHQVIEAATGEIAARRAVEESPIDLLLTDIMMSPMLGTDLALLLHSTMPELRVVYMSGYFPSAVRAEPFVHKPFSRKDLLDAVEIQLADPPAMLEPKLE